MLMTYFCHSARNRISLTVHVIISYLSTQLKKRSINSRIVSIANWILHQSTSTQLGRQTFVEKVSSKTVKKVRPGDLIDFVREQFFRVYISKAVMYIASFTLM